jgi:hypothetical protein
MELRADLCLVISMRAGGRVVRTGVCRRLWWGLTLRGLCGVQEGGAGCDEGGSAPAPDPCSEIDFMACYSRTQPIKATDKEGAMESG